MREAFRLNKAEIYDILAEKGIKIQLLLVYISPEEITYHEMESKLKTVLNQIITLVKSTSF